MKKLLFIIFFIGTCLNAQNINDAANQISRNNLMETIKILCSDEYAGRLSGHPGYNKAAEFAADKFKELQLKKINGSYFQRLRVEYNEILNPVKLNLVENNSVVKEYQPGKDFVCRGFTGSGNVISEVVFCGYGIDKEFYSDFDGIDVRNKIIMIFKPNPSWKIGENNWDSGYPRQKSNTAAENGAAGIIMVSTPNSENPQKPVASVLHGDGTQELQLPQIHVELDAAEELLKNSGYTLKQLQKTIDSTKKPFSVPLNTTVELSVNAKYDSSAETMNVWALMEGSDPVLKNEYIIIGAHLDHVGKQGNVIFPGANDNASGSAAVLEIAAAFVKSGIKPKRSVIFALFASEEQGLFGSKYMADNLPAYAGSITAMLNLDCIAYGDSIQVGNGKSAPVLWNIAREIDKAGENYMVETTWKGGGADAGPFHDKGIPAIYFASTNSYENIHTIYDTPESLNPELMEKITRLAFLIAEKVADDDYKREVVVN